MPTFPLFSRKTLRYCGLLLGTALAADASAQTAAVAGQRLAAMGVEASAERLVQFAAQGDSTVVGLLLQTGLDSNAAEPLRQVTAVHNAAAQGHLRLLATLVERGAKVDPADGRGNTPLINAAYFGHLEVVKLLLKHGANVNAVSKEGLSPLSAATYSGKQAVVAYLLEQGAVDTAAAAGAAQLARRESMAESIRRQRNPQ